MDTLIGFDNLGQRLRILLDKFGYTQKSANEELGFSPSTIGNYIHGRTPDPSRLLEISKFFKVSMEFLLTGEEKIKKIRDEEIQLTRTFKALNEKEQKKASCYLDGITTPFDSLEKRLEFLIENAGYKQAEISKGTKLHENSISNYANGTTPVSENLYKLSKFFEIPMEWFVTGEVIIEGLSKEENQFIRNYRMLKLKEQGKIIGYMDCLLDVEN